ncbi:DUF3889 domain-containing protein [Bacillus lacus]|uniref:DUF3889 domain-containing protein n=1 Tax=Metabacillus lacus TaxID=1983721 RepID=A0A7X2LYJ3_9BACI|nr:DUF3889 domain-containing protein [Metabacillus lacus]MRX71903.1 DUF3889 domain-containing protein [Metabacillus lacus]
MMRALLTGVLLISILFFPFAQTALCFQAEAALETPSHAKWGKLAVEKVREAYPSANIADYFHIGRTEEAKTAVESFRLWMKEGSKEYGLLVMITYDKQTERVISIKISKIS